MRDYVDITILLDRSGSMQSIKGAMESGFDEFVQGHRKNPSTRLTLIQFDNQARHEVVFMNAPIESVGKLVLDPRGMTPLYDAMCEAIDATGRRFRHMAEEDRPNKVIFITVTDGLENASRYHTARDVGQRVRTQEEQFNWDFIYLGANQDAILEGSKMDVQMTKSITYTATPAATMMSWRGLTSNTVNYADTGNKAALDWSDLQRNSVIDTTNNT